MEKKLAMILQTREEGRLREKLLSAQKGNVLGHHGMENVAQMMDMVPNMSGTSNIFSVFEGDGLSKNCMSGEEVSETTFATKVMGVQGAHLNLVELEMDGLGAGQTEMIEDAGTEEDKENDLRRSSRPERLGRVDDKVEDRAIYNAKVRNLELPKGITLGNSVLSTSNQELINLAKKLNVSLDFDSVTELASLILLRIWKRVDWICTYRLIVKLLHLRFLNPWQNNKLP